MRRALIVMVAALGLLVGLLPGTASARGSASAASATPREADLSASATHTISGTVTNATGDPISGAGVAPYDIDADQWSAIEAETAADGTYAMQLPAGTYALFFAARDHLGGWWTASGYEGDSANATAVVIAGDAVFNIALPDGPRAFEPSMRFRIGSATSGAHVPVRVTWGAYDVGTGLDSYALERLKNGVPSPVTLSPPTTTSVNQSIDAGSAAWRFQVTITDTAGNIGGPMGGPSITLSQKQESWSKLSWTKTWSRTRASSASGGYVRTTTTRGARVKFTFDAAGFAWVAPRGPQYGKAKVWVDGSYKGIVDLRASSNQSQRIVFQWVGGLPDLHTVVIENQATSGRPRIGIDQLLVVDYSSY